MSAKRKTRKKVEEETMENVEIINNEEIVTPETITEVVEEINENNGTVEEVIQTIEEGTKEVEEVTPEIIPEVIEVKPVIGKIFGFDKLYVRSEASRASDPVGTVETNDELIIDLENSTDEFYKVRTATGLDGYCVKSNIKID